MKSHVKSEVFIEYLREGATGLARQRISEVGKNVTDEQLMQLYEATKKLAGDQVYINGVLTIEEAITK